MPVFSPKIDSEKLKGFGPRNKIPVGSEKQKCESVREVKKVGSRKIAHQVHKL
jgi:hypothetical protein